MYALIEVIKNPFLWIIQTVQLLANLISGGEPLVKGLVTVAIVSAIGVFGRRLPGKIINFVSHKLFLKIIYDRPVGETSMSIYAYENFSKYLGEVSNSSVFKLSRNVSFDKNKNLIDKVIFGVGSSSGIFIHNGKLCIFSRFIKDGDKTTIAVDKISLRILFGKKADVELILPSLEKDEKRYFYMNERFRSFVIPLSELSNDYVVFIPKKLKNQIDSAIAYFLDNKLEMLSRGIPWKLTFMFYGPPGTGKTTLISYIAKALDRSIFCPTDEIDYVSLSAANRNNAILALEDIDCFSFTKKRKTKVVLKEDSVDEEFKENKANNGLSLFLNYLQGPGPLNGDVTVMTTNHIEKLDPAIYRPGRVDEKIFVDFYGIEDLKDWSLFYYRELYEEPKDLVFETNLKFRPGDMAELYRKNAKDIQSFYKQVYNRSLESNKDLMEKVVVECNQLLEEVKQSSKIN